MEYFLGRLTIPYDKALHALYGMVIYSVLVLYMSYGTALTCVVVCALLKELYDYFNKDKHTVDIMDIAATAFVPVVLFFLQWITTVLSIEI